MIKCWTRLYSHTAMSNTRPLLATVLCCYVLWWHLAVPTMGSSVATFHSRRENSYRQYRKHPNCFIKVSTGPSLLSCKVDKLDNSECSQVFDSTSEKSPEVHSLVTELHYTEDGEMQASLSDTLKTYVSSELRILVSTFQTCWSVHFNSIPRRDQTVLHVVNLPIPSGSDLAVDSSNGAMGSQYSIAVLNSNEVLLKKTVYLRKDISMQANSQLDFRELPELESDSGQWVDVFPDRGEDDVTLDPEKPISIEEEDFRDGEDGDGEDGDEEFRDGEDDDSVNGSQSLSRRMRSTCTLPSLSNANSTSYYDRTSATVAITISTNVACTGICCEVKVMMLKHMKAETEKECSALEKKRSAYNNLLQVTKTTVLLLNTPFHSTPLRRGCYTAQLWRTKNDQLMNPFLWADPLVDIPDLNRWNTTFSLRAKPELGEVVVRWHEPPAPYNFTHYSLQLWYQTSPTLTCVGLGGSNNDEPRVRPTPSKPLNKTEGLFDSLLPGYYCARVTPIDDRCVDGCAVRASHTIYLSPPSVPSNDSSTSKPSPSTFSWEIMIVIIFISVAVCAVVLCSIVYMVKEKIINRNKESSDNGKNTLPGKAPLLTQCTGKKASILLVYTCLRDTNGVLKRRVRNLKKLLSQHLNVYDYLDLSSMEANQRELLLQNPASWLQTLLLKTDTKLLLMMTPSSTDWMSCVEGVATSPTGSECVTALDRTLYPHTLRLVSHNSLLMGNYSKVFVTRFEECSSVCTTDNISQGRVYVLPLHLNSLVSALSGESYESGDFFSDFEMQEFVEVCQEQDNTLTNCV